MYSINRVLVPTDFSDVANNALATAIEICKRQLATLTLVHVIDGSAFYLSPEGGLVSHPQRPKRVKEFEDTLGKVAKSLRLTHDLVVNHLVVSGDPAEKTCAIAIARSIDLIVLGTHNSSGLHDFFLGSNAFRVVRNSPCPVMTVPGYRPWPNFRRILFPVRMVPHTLEKYNYVRPIVCKNDSSILAVGVARKKAPEEFAEVKALMDLFRRQVAEDYVICDCELYDTENVARKVMDIAEKEKPDLIVITANQEPSIKEFFMGPYAQDIVTHSRFPVLCIRPGTAVPHQPKSPGRL